MNIATLLSAQASANPSSIAIVDAKGGASRQFSFKEMERRASRAAGIMREHGVQANDAVLVVHPINAELYVALTAIFKLGATAVFLDPSANKEFIESCFEMLKPSALVTTALGALLPLVSRPLRQIERQFSTGAALAGLVCLDSAASDKFVFDNAQLDDNTPALVTFTSGSTGKPKAIVRSHGFLRHQLAVTKRSFDYEEAEVDMTNLPVFVLANLAGGLTSVIPNADLRKPGRIAAAPVVAQIIRREVTRMTASPAFLDRICRYCQRKGIKLVTLRKIYTGGGPVFPRLMAELQRVAPFARIHTVYGSTEAEPIAMMELSQMTEEDRALMCSGSGLLVGRPESSVSVRIISSQLGLQAANRDSAVMPQVHRSNFDRLTLPQGVPGEIVVSGAHVIKTYLHGRGVHETKLSVEGEIWHRTGDAGYFDEEGRLWLVGRCGARIEDEFGSIYPFQVESAALERSYVRHAACVFHHGKRILVIELEKSVDVFDMNQRMRLLRDELSWAQIDDVKLIERMPLDERHNSKICYADLLHRLSA